MKWLVVVLCLARYAEGGAIRCTPGMDSPCTAEDVEKIPEASIQLSHDGDGRNETTRPEVECQAGSEWDSNCHSCRCSDFGIAVCKRKEDCLQEIFAEPLKCKPNTTFSRDCSTCVCLESGLGLCTLDSCRSNVPKKSQLVSGRECAAGTRWKSQCNDCVCSPSGYSSCTEQHCGETSEPVLRCAPDSMWKNDCNSCWCTTIGHAMCTRMGCINLELPSDFVRQNAKNEMNKEANKQDETIADFSIEYEEDETANNEFSHRDPKKSSDLKNYEYSEYPDHSFEEIDENIQSKLYDELENEHELNENDNVLGEIDNKKIHVVLKRSVCKPNEVFQSECNSCKCDPDGHSYTCTQNECMEGEKNKEVEVFMENEGTDHVERHSVCKPQGTFYIGCNTCHCNNYGTDYSCTNKPCPLPEDVELFHELRATKSESKNKTQKVVCVANRMFIKDCNTCWCNEDGTGFFCTRKVCVPELPDEASDDEKPENITLIRKTRGVAQEVPKTCQPGQEFRMDCNKCLCDNEGQDFSCTRNDCNAPNGNQGSVRSKRDTSETIPVECNPGSVFDRDCNVCRCTADGLHAVCTIKRCTAAVSHDNDIDTKLPESDPNFRCNPGEQFKRGCNDCSCSADGKSVFCTLRFCDQDITPPPSL